MGSGSSPGSHSSSNQKSLKTEMLSFPLMVALFKGSAALACEGDQALEEGLGGTITSVNYPNNYEDNTDCSFTILPVPGNHVTLQFTDFHVDYSHGGGCKGLLYTFPREEPVTITFPTNEFTSAKGFS